MSDRHTTLILEDNPENAAALRDLVGAMDMDACIVTTLEELRALLATGFKPCAALLDMQVPYAAGARPHEKAGESAIAMVQSRWQGETRVAIVVVTAFRSDPEYVWAMAELKVDEFCAKSNIGALGDKLTSALKKAGRCEHRECRRRDGDGDGAVAGEARAAREAGTPTSKPAVSAAQAPIAAPESMVTTAPALEENGRVRVAMLGEPARRGRTTIRICGETRTMEDVPFANLLRVVEVQEREPGGWLDRFDLGLGLNRAATTRVRAPFRGLAAADFQVFEADGRKRFRLNPAIVLEKTDWVTIAQHPEPAIAAIAEKALRRKGK